MQRILSRVGLSATIAVSMFMATVSAAPDPITFENRENVPVSSFVSSQTRTVSGLSGGPEAISVSANDNTQYRIGSGAYTNDAGTIADGDKLTLRHVTSSTALASVTSTATIGGAEFTFTTITTDQDRAPHEFSFGNKSNVAPGALVESRDIVLSGYNAAMTIIPSSNAEYSVNGGAWTSANGTLQVGQRIKVRHLASETKPSYTRSHLKIGGVRGYFTTRTEAPVAPVAVDDFYQMDASNILNVAAPGVLTNDPSDDPIEATLIDSVGDGVLELNSDGSFIYTPDLEFSGTVTFTYKTTSGELEGETATVTIDVVALPPVMTRYDMANRCFAIKANATGKFLTREQNGSYRALGDDVGAGEPIRFKPSALGHYLFYLDQRVPFSPQDPRLTEYGDIIAVNAQTPGSQALEIPLSQAAAGSEWTIAGVGDSTAYPNTPLYDFEPMLNSDAFPPNEPGDPVWNLDEYRDFVEPFLEFSEFTISSRDAPQAMNLAVLPSGTLGLVPPGSDAANESFSFVPTRDCNNFPEAQSDLAIEDAHPQGLPTSFAGTNPVNGGVLGHADIHVHISSSTFLGGAQYGANHHRYGITHALSNCDQDHGQTGSEDAVGGLFSGQTSHDTLGYPTFPDWPSRSFLTHEAIYWKWLERAWQAGSRLIVNELVDNETLCELTASQSDNQNADCNSQRNAKDQIGTMYSMQDLIDANYGGPGKGFMRIVRTPEEARTVIEDGKIAMVLGLEISNTIDCKVIYNNPARQQQPHEETGAPQDGGVTYTCTPQSIDTDLERLWELGVRKIISIHEFDNAFGGNGIFNDFLNLGNRENSGGQPPSDNPQGDPFANQPKGAQETPFGEFWTTYQCPDETVDDPSIVDDPNADGGPFSGYFWGSIGGTNLGASELLPPPPNCQPVGQGGREGGSTNCYTKGIRQCNARWMTPIGLHFYKKLMSLGFVFDFDHMEMSMKNQALELTEAQEIPYPIVSSHGTFGGTTQHQAMRVLKNGGVMYPSIGSSAGFRRDMDETMTVYNVAVQQLINEGKSVPLFGFGYGTDTNGLSSQSGPRSGAAVAANPVVYPYTLFEGGIWEQLPEFASISGVTFDRPGNVDPLGQGRTGESAWHEDIDGNAHYGMLSGIVQEMVLDAPVVQESPDVIYDVSYIRHMFNSAETYLRAWKNTNNSRDSITAAGGVAVPSGLLRPAPVSVHAGEVAAPDPTDCGPADLQNQNPDCLQ